MEEIEILEGLIKQAKEECRITWESADTDEIIKGIVEDANITVKRKIGIPEDMESSVFLEPGTARIIWKAYCLYRWNNEEANFDTNYLPDIMQARREYEVKYARKKDQVQ